MAFSFPLMHEAFPSNLPLQNHGMIVKTAHGLSCVSKSKESEKTKIPLNILLKNLLLEVKKSSTTKIDLNRTWAIASYFASRATSPKNIVIRLIQDLFQRIINLFKGNGFITNKGLVNKIRNEILQRLPNDGIFLLKHEHLERCFELRNGPQFLKSLELMSPNEIADYVQNKMKLLSKVVATPEDEPVVFLLSTLKLRYPNFFNIDLFFHCKDKGIAIRPNGSKIIVDYLQAQKKMPVDAKIIVCDSFENFEKELKKIDWNVLEKVAFLVQSLGDGCYYSEHVCPILIQKSKNGMDFDIILSDSIGNNPLRKFFKKTFSEYIAARIQKGIPQQVDYAIFVQNEKRQFNGTSCAVFSIYDLRYLLSNPDAVEYIKAQFAGKNIANRAINYFDNLPTAMMRTDHRHENLIKKSLLPLHKDTIVHTNKRTNAPETLYDNVMKHTRLFRPHPISPLTAFNAFTYIKEIKFAGIILAHAIRNG